MLSDLDQLISEIEDETAYLNQDECREVSGDVADSLGDLEFEYRKVEIILEYQLKGRFRLCH